MSGIRDTHGLKYYNRGLPWRFLKISFPFSFSEYVIVKLSFRYHTATKVGIVWNTNGKNR